MLHTVGTRIAVVALVPVLLLSGAANGESAKHEVETMGVDVDGLTSGDVVTGEMLSLTVRPIGFTFSLDDLGSDPIDGQGHYHVHIDGSLRGMYASPDAIVDLHGVSAGSHTVTVLPAWNDHTEVTDGAVAIAFDYQPEPSALSDEETIVISLTEMAMSPSNLMLSPGTYTFQADNDGAIEHGLWIVGDGFQAGTPDSSYAGGTSQEFTVELAPGTYELVCPVPWHKVQGMVGEIVVSQ